MSDNARTAFRLIRAGFAIGLPFGLAAGFAGCAIIYTITH